MAGRRSGTREVLGRVRDLGSRGEGVVETEDGVVFVPGALPGERVRISVAGGKKKRGVKRGQLRAIVEPSAARVAPPCEVQSRCGGCPLMILSASEQTAYKARAAADATGLAVTVERAGEPLGYRRRARLAFGRGVLGYRPPRDKGIVDVARCPVLETELDAALVALRAEVLPTLAGHGELTLAKGAGAKPVAWIRTEAAQPPTLYRALEGAVETGTLAGAALAIGGTAPATFGAPEEVTEGVDGELLVGPAFGFAQANAAVNRVLVERAVTLAAPQGARVLELYAGHGNLSVALARRAESLRCVEQSEEAVAHLRTNLSRRGLEARVVAADAAEGAAQGGAVDVVVLDPPRTGARDAVGPILEKRPERIVYVSCDPATLKRDVEALREGGYSPREASAFDMFPQTAHLEVAVLLQR